MISPGMKRPSVWKGGVLQIWVTRACDKSCFGCTQGSNLAGETGRITPNQFDEACKSLKGYFGVIGMFGGNPAVHPQFDLLCEIMRSHFPKNQCGLWCNKLFGKGSHARMTFNPAVSNLNVHLDREAYDEFKRDWPESQPFGLNQDSRHSPPYVAMQDVIESEEERWELISNCDINQKWSAMIGVFRDTLRGYFCEVAGAQAMLHQREEGYPDHGVPIVKDWWQAPMRDFAKQVKFHCFSCGVPLRGRGELSQESNGIEQASKTHAEIYQPKKKDREVQIVKSLEEMESQALTLSTDYLGNAKL